GPWAAYFRCQPTSISPRASYRRLAARATLSRPTRLRLERVAHQDDVVALRARRNDGGRATGQFLDAADVLDRIGRQILGAAHAARCRLPAVARFVEGGDRFVVVDAAGHVVVGFVDAHVGGASLDLVNAVKHVEPGE